MTTENNAKTTKMLGLSRLIFKNTTNKKIKFWWGPLYWWVQRVSASRALHALLQTLVPDLDVGQRWCIDRVLM